MVNILDYVAKKMSEFNISSYDIEPALVKVSAQAIERVGETGQFLFLATLSTDSGIVQGKVISSDNGLQLNPSVAATEMFKHQMFRGTTRVFNQGDVPLSVEFVVCTPIHCPSRRGLSK